MNYYVLGANNRKIVEPEKTLGGKNLTKDIYNVYIKNYKPWLREIKEDLNKWRDTSSSLIGRLSIAKMAMFPKLIHRLNTIPTKIAFF